MILKTISVIFTLIINTRQSRDDNARTHVYNAHVVGIIEIVHEISETTATANHFVKKKSILLLK